MHALNLLIMDHTYIDLDLVQHMYALHRDNNIVIRLRHESPLFFFHSLIVEKYIVIQIKCFNSLIIFNLMRNYFCIIYFASLIYTLKIFIFNIKIIYT